MPLASRLLAIFFDRPADGARSRSRLSGELDGKPLPPPFVGTDLDLVAGGRRHVLLIGRRLGDTLGRRVTLALDGETMAVVEPGWLQPPVADAPALVAGLARGAQARLQKLLLTTGASLLATPDAGGFVDGARRLLDACDVAPLEAASVAAIGRSRRLLTFCLPPGAGAARAAEPLLLSPRRVSQAKDVAVLVEPGPAGDLLHLCLPAPAPWDAEVVLLGSHPLRLKARTGRAQPLPAWGASRPAHVRAWARGLARAAVQAGDAPEGLLRELRDDAAAPVLSVRHLSATDAGIVYVLGLRDPDRLVRSVLVERGAQRGAIEPELGPDGAGALTGVLPLGGDADAGEPCRIRLVRHSGATRLVHAAVLRPFDGAVPLGFAEARDEALAAGREDPAPVLARAQLAKVPGPVLAVAQTFGPEPARLCLSIVAPLGGDPDVVRARAALVALEGGAATAEVVCVASAGPPASAARRLAATAAAVFAVRHRVVTVGPQSSPADMLRAGLTHAKAESALWLAADALPARAGWLGSWTIRLGAAGAPSVLAAPVLDHDGTELADGLGTADCIGLSRAGIARLLGLELSHSDPSVLLAALGPRGTAGLSIAAIRYGPCAPEEPLIAALRAAALDLVSQDWV